MAMGGGRVMSDWGIARCRTAGSKRAIQNRPTSEHKLGMGADGLNGSEGRRYLNQVGRIHGA